MKKILPFILIGVALAALAQNLTPPQQSAVVQQFAARMTVATVTNQDTTITITVTLPAADYRTLQTARFAGEQDNHYVARAFANGVFFLNRQIQAMQNFNQQQGYLYATNSTGTNSP